MDIIKYIAVGISGAILAVMLKEYKPAFSVCIIVASVVFLFFGILGQISYIFDIIKPLVEHTSIKTIYIEIIIKITGISYIAHLGGNICKDCGFASLSLAVELCGKIIIVSQSLPLLLDVMNLLVGLL